MTSFLKKWGGPLLTGMVLALCFPRWHLYPLMWLALVPLFLGAFQAPPLVCAARFFCAGFSFYALLLQWLLANVYWAGGWAIWGYLLLSGFLAAYWGVLGFIWASLRDRLRWAPVALSMVVLWVAMEYFQGILLTGLGWGALGYAQGGDLAFFQLASLGGVGLLSAIIVAFNMLVAQRFAVPDRWLLPTAAALVLLVGSHLLGALFLHEADYGSKPFQVALVQSDFPQEMKWDPEYSEEMVEKTVERTRLALAEMPADLIVWPEALVMAPLNMPRIRAAIGALVHEADAALFTGASRYDEAAEGWANSSYLIDSTGAVVGYYDKIHLAPFGEYVPLSGYFPFLRRAVPFEEDVLPGAGPKVFAVGRMERRFGPLICFEVVFPSMAERLRRDGADFLIVVTNLGWFGLSGAVPQELEISRMRAVETRLPLVHCANTGFTGVFDPWGRFVSIGPSHARIAGVLPVPGPSDRLLRDGPRTFPLLAVIGSVVLIGFSLPRRRRPPSVRA